MDRHTGESPEDLSEHCFEEFRSDLSFYYSFNPFNYAKLQWSMCLHVDELSKSLKLIHDLALYHSEIEISDDEKSSLYNLKVLWEGLERISQES